MAELIARTVVAGVPFAIVAALLGSFIQWRKMAFFGDAMAHSALLGIGLSLLFGINHMVGVIAVLVLIALYLHLSEDSKLPADTRLSVSAHLSLAGGSLAIFFSGSRVHWESILFGNILSLTTAETAALLAVSLFIVATFAWLWPRLLLKSVNNEIASAEQDHMRLADLAFLILLSAFVAVGVRVVGVLLLSALLIIPAAAARPLARSPLFMVAIAAVIGSACILAGIGITFSFDVPMAPVCVLLAGLAYGISWTWSTLKGKHN